MGGIRTAYLIAEWKYDYQTVIFFGFLIRAENDKTESREKMPKSKSASFPNP